MKLCPVLLSLALACEAVLAGPPFQTDDPEPVGYHQYEAYLYGTYNRTRDGHGLQAPGSEFNWGPTADVQLHIQGQMTASIHRPGPSTYGIGDIEVGVKYRFLHETGVWPQVCIYPALELPVGEARRNLGNGQTWARLPVWIQKTMGPWTTYGGGGEVINNAPGMRSYPFGGWLLERDFGERLTLGGEVFAHGAIEAGGTGPPAATLIDVGGSYNFNRGFSLLFAGGHSVSGGGETYAYLGLYWTWGPASSRQPSAPGRPLGPWLKPGAR